MISSKFLSKPVNFLPFALFQFFHHHVISSSSFYPLPLPTSHLPSPSPFAWAEANLWSTTLSTPIWILDCDFSCISCIFRILTHVSKMFDVSFIRRIGLLDKLVQVSSPILLALRWIDMLLRIYICNSTAALLSTAAVLPIKYLKHCLSHIEA